MRSGSSEEGLCRSVRHRLTEDLLSSRFRERLFPSLSDFGFLRPVGCLQLFALLPGVTSVIERSLEANDDAAAVSGLELIDDLVSPNSPVANG